MNMSEVKLIAIALLSVIAATAIVLGFLFLVLGVEPSYRVRIITDAAPATPQSDTIDTGFSEDLKASPCSPRLRIPLRTDGEAP